MKMLALVLAVAMNVSAGDISGGPVGEGPTWVKPVSSRGRYLPVGNAITDSPEDCKPGADGGFGYYFKEQECLQMLKVALKYKALILAASEAYYCPHGPRYSKTACVDTVGVYFEDPSPRAEWQPYGIGILGALNDEEFIRILPGSLDGVRVYLMRG